MCIYVARAKGDLELQKIRQTWTIHRNHFTETAHADAPLSSNLLAEVVAGARALNIAGNSGVASAETVLGRHVTSNAVALQRRCLHSRSLSAQGLRPRHRLQPVLLFQQWKHVWLDPCVCPTWPQSTKSKSMGASQTVNRINPVRGRRKFRL